jgi:hypothetical protein
MDDGKPRTKWPDEAGQDFPLAGEMGSQKWTLPREYWNAVEVYYRDRCLTDDDGVDDWKDRTR